MQCSTLILLLHVQDKKKIENYKHNLANDVSAKQKLFSIVYTLSLVNTVFFLNKSEISCILKSAQLVL